MGTLFTALGAAAALAGTDIIPVHQGGPRAVGLTGAQLLTYVGGSYVGKTGAQSMTGALTIASGTLTASAPALNITQTWNGVGQRFDALVMDITNTNSANSYPVIIRVGGTEQMYLTKTGDLYAQNFRVLTNTGLIGIGSDVFILRDAAATLAQRNGTNAQTLRVYGTYTSASVYERLSFSTTATSGATIAVETLGATADLDLSLVTPGTGKLKFGTHSAIAAETVTGYITIKDAGGTTRKLAVVS